MKKKGVPGSFLELKKRVSGGRNRPWGQKGEGGVLLIFPSGRERDAFERKQSGADG